MQLLRRQSPGWAVLALGVALILSLLIFLQVRASIILSYLPLVDESIVDISYSRIMFNRRTGAYQITATLNNVSDQSISTPAYFAIEDIAPDTITVLNADAVSADGTPYFTVNESDMQPGEQRSEAILFNNPSRAQFTFTGQLYARIKGEPSAVAGPAANALVGNIAKLDGSQSYDPDGDLITFLWSIADAPSGSAASLIGATGPEPNFTPDLAGEFLIELVVNDGQLDSAVARVVVTAELTFAPPNARAGRDVDVAIGTTVNLDGTDSFDPNDLPLGFSWTFLSVPSTSVLTDGDIAFSDSANGSFVPDVGGTYLMNLQVGNGTLTDDDTVKVAALSPNIPPTADAGPVVSVQSGQVATLDGSGSVDPDAAPAALTFSWSFVARPAGSLLTDTDIADAQADASSFVPDVQGAYVVRLTVDDGAATNEENVVVYADNTPPQIVIVPAHGSIVNTTTPTIAVSYDDGPESGLNLSSFYAFLNGVDVTASMFVGTNGATHTPATPLPFAENTAIARISDRAGNEAIAVSKFIVNTPPEIVTDPLTVAMVGKPYEYDVDATDADNDPLAFSLTVNPPGMTIDSPSGLIAWTPSEAGDTRVTVRVEDTRGGSAEQDFVVRILVEGVKSPPIAAAGLNQTVAVGVRVTLDGSASRDPDGGSIVSFTWMESGVEIGSQVVIEVDLAVGEHVVTLVVIDDEGETGSDTVAISVRDTAAYASLAECAADIGPGEWSTCDGPSLPLLTGAEINAIDAQYDGVGLTLGNNGSRCALVAWTDAGWSADRQTMYFNGGGHKCYGGGEWYSFDVRTLTAKRLNLPGVFKFGASFVDEVVSTGEIRVAGSQFNPKVYPPDWGWGGLDKPFPLGVPMPPAGPEGVTVNPTHSYSGRVLHPPSGEIFQFGGQFYSI